LLVKDIDHKTACKNYVKAATKGVIKVMAKMGISTIQSYRGAQIFEAIGLQDVIDKYFTWTPSRVEGVGLDVIAQEVLMRHRALPDAPGQRATCWIPAASTSGATDGEYHLFNPRRSTSCRRPAAPAATRFSRNTPRWSTTRPRTSARCAAARLQGAPSRSRSRRSSRSRAIVKRFKTGAMSYGSISKEAHETLAIAMNRIGGKSNTGEGGEDPAATSPMPNGDSKNSAIKQVASGRFGVTSQYLVNARELQIKMAQGAKPGEGGQLPGTRSIRGSPRRAATPRPASASSRRRRTTTFIPSRTWRS
jgi:glutamate synthase domain-containing protein 2